MGADCWGTTLIGWFGSIIVRLTLIELDSFRECPQTIFQDRLRGDRKCDVRAPESHSFIRSWIVCQDRKKKRQTIRWSVKSARRKGTTAVRGNRVARTVQCDMATPLFFLRSYHRGDSSQLKQGADITTSILSVRLLERASVSQLFVEPQARLEIAAPFARAAQNAVCRGGTQQGRVPPAQVQD